mmetsp:Transcript_81843/g.228000  ORF Transcript_81843/g.228000 Transcript_81843/m.228000 type:complete len:239 (+) Transcript_81843:2188-2904(+)
MALLRSMYPSPHPGTATASGNRAPARTAPWQDAIQRLARRRRPKSLSRLWQGRRRLTSNRQWRAIALRRAALAAAKRPRDHGSLQRRLQRLHCSELPRAHADDLLPPSAKVPGYAPSLRSTLLVSPPRLFVGPPTASEPQRWGFPAWSGVPRRDARVPASPPATACETSQCHARRRSRRNPWRYRAACTPPNRRKASPPPCRPTRYARRCNLGTPSNHLRVSCPPMGSPPPPQARRPN